MDITLAQLSYTEGNIKRNLEKALSVIYNCNHDTDIIVFPEMYLTGFVETDHVSDRALSLESQEITTLHEVAKEKDIAIAIGLIESKGNTFYNSTILITPEERVALCYRKTHLWPDERNLVQPGDRLSTCLWRGTRIGLLICYDIEFPEPARALASMGADLLLITNGNMDRRSQ